MSSSLVIVHEQDSQIIKVISEAEPTIVKVFVEGPQGPAGAAGVPDPVLVTQTINTAISTISIDGSYF